MRWFLGSFLSHFCNASVLTPVAAAARCSLLVARHCPFLFTTASVWVGLTGVSAACVGWYERRPLICVCVCVYGAVVLHGGGGMRWSPCQVLVKAVV